MFTGASDARAGLVWSWQISGGFYTGGETVVPWVEQGTFLTDGTLADTSASFKYTVLDFDVTSSPVPGAVGADYCVAVGDCKDISTGGSGVAYGLKLTIRPGAGGLSPFALPWIERSPTLRQSAGESILRADSQYLYALQSYNVSLFRSNRALNSDNLNYTPIEGTEEVGYGDFAILSVADASSVPEPGTGLLAAAAVAVVAACVRRRA